MIDLLALVLKNKAFILFMGFLTVAGLIATRYLPKPGTVPAQPDNLNVMVDSDDFTAADKRNMKTVIIRWNDIARITVIATDNGPLADNRFYHIIHANGELTLPAGANGMGAFVTRISALPGFDSRALEAALKTDQNNSFSVVFAKAQ